MKAMNMKQQLFDYTVAILCCNEDEKVIREALESVKPSTTEQKLIVYQRGKMHKAINSKLG